MSRSDYTVVKRIQQGKTTFIALKDMGEDVVAVVEEYHDLNQLGAKIADRACANAAGSMSVSFKRPFSIYQRWPDVQAWRCHELTESEQMMFELGFFAGE